MLHSQTHFDGEKVLDDNTDIDYTYSSS